MHMRIRYHFLAKTRERTFVSYKQKVRRPSGKYFTNICNLSPSIFQISITMICSEMLLLHFSCYFGKRRRFLQPGAYSFPTSSFHASLDTVFNHFNGMRKSLLKKR